MKYFTADLHLCHPFVAATRGFYKRTADVPEQARRPDGINAFRHNMSEEDFNALVDVERHDRTVINHINARVGKRDELYILGDLSSGGAANLRRALSLLDELHVPPSRRHLVLGNHDGFRMKPSNAADIAVRFGSVSDNLFIDIDGIPAVLSHVPRYEYLDGSVREGMASNSLEKTLRKHAPRVPYDIIHLYGHTHGRNPDEFHDGWNLNVGLDAWSLRPVSEDEVKKTLLIAQGKA